ncbi:MAG: hypothetical protein RIR55_1480 [Bacteroidota bacterium]|jgi:CheY-like chemotaxis protein
MSDLNTRITVLVVDDNEHKMVKVVKTLQEYSELIEIIQVEDQISAQQELARTKFDLLILDMCLPLRKLESEPDHNGGENLLDELEIEGAFKQPSKIITLTQYDELQSSVRQKFPELGAIKFDETSNVWKESLLRTIKGISRFKKETVKIIYCEELNDVFYNQIGLPNIEFRGLKGGSRKVYEAAKFEKDKYALRDKDYLTTNEVKWLTESFMPNYYILDYYCFENYLFHPENIDEYCNSKGKEFDKAQYIAEIVSQKKSKFLKIVQNYIIARNGYFDFTDNERRNMDKEPEREIVTSLESDELEVFYPYFDMKGTDKNKGFDRSCIENLNLDKKELASTCWFKSKMENILSDLINI